MELPFERVLMAGVGLSLLPCAMLFCFRDANTLGVDSEALHINADVHAAGSSE